MYLACGLIGAYRRLLGVIQAACIFQDQITLAGSLQELSFPLVKKDSCPIF